MIKSKEFVGDHALELLNEWCLKNDVFVDWVISIESFVQEYHDNSMKDKPALRIFYYEEE